jgi:hypothetical protein
MPTAESTWVDASQLRKRKLRHGFKAHAKRTANELREEHGYSRIARIDAIELAEAMNITVAPLSSFPECVTTLHLTNNDPTSFSAATLRLEEQTMIVHHDGHTIERQMSNVGHEIGHVVLAHEDSPPFSLNGCRDIYADIENEAAYFGSVLLVPDEAVLTLARKGRTIAESAEILGVSVQMMQWRFNDSGAARRLRRARN